MSITTLLTLLVSSMLIYSAPLIFTSIGGVFSERGGVVNVGLEGIMVMGAFSGVVFNLEFAEQFGAATPWLSLLVAGLVGGLSLSSTQQRRFISVQTMLSAVRY